MNPSLLSSGHAVHAAGDAIAANADRMAAIGESIATNATHRSSLGESAAPLRDQLLGLALRIKPINLPELGGRVFVRQMSGLQREQLERSIGDGGSPTVRARVAVASLCDEAGKLQFTEADIDGVNSLPWTILDAIYKGALEFNAMAPDAVDTAAKN